MKVLAVVGTRPEALKVAPLVLALRRHGGFELHLVATGQHDELLHQALSAFGLAVDETLLAMQPGQSLAQTLARLLAAIDQAIERQAPGLVIGQGDTTSCLAAALAAFYRGVPFAHIEAGLRSGEWTMPFPEEAQRQLIDRLSTLHFAPTAAAADAVRRELPDAREVHTVGNTGIDALRTMLERPVPSPWPDPCAPHRLLATVHRRESFGAPLAAICAALQTIALRDDVQLLVPVHPNPTVHAIVYAALAGREHVHLIAPLPYAQMVAALRGATLLLTDSGGLQEEAPMLGLPVLVLRERTERPEGVAALTARLVGTGTAHIVAEVTRLLDEPGALSAMQRVHHPYGDGFAAERITALLARWAGR